MPAPDWSTLLLYTERVISMWRKLIHRQADSGIVILNGRRIPEAKLVYLEEVPNLVVLSLSDIAVTDAGLVHLQGLEDLRELYLTRTKISDAGLVHLEGLTRLEEL